MPLEAFPALVSKQAKKKTGNGTILELISPEILCFWRLNLNTQFKIELFFPFNSGHLVLEETPEQDINYTSSSTNINVHLY